MSLTPSDYAGIENHQITLKFANALQLLAQQTVSKLESCVTVKSGLKGATVSPADQLGTFSTKTRENRYEETPAVNVSRTRRWYSPTMKHGAYIIDTFDSIKMDLNPQEGIVQSMLAAYHRDIDATILADFLPRTKWVKTLLPRQILIPPTSLPRRTLPAMSWEKLRWLFPNCKTKTWILNRKKFTW